MSLKCWFGFHDFEWSHSSLISPIKRETYPNIYFLLRCKRCGEKGLFDKVVLRGGSFLSMQRQTILTEEEFNEWSWVDPPFAV